MGLHIEVRRSESGKHRRRITMKRLLTLFAVSAALAVTASAQQVGQPLLVDVPFAFTAGKKLLNAGVYRVTMANSSVVSFRNEDGGTSAAMIIATRTSLKAADAAPKVIFNRYGNEYYLARVCNLQQNIGANVAPSKQEKELRARYGSNPDQVTVARR
jgi:hypothetical protein